jgi:hypothetical protein
MHVTNTGPWINGMEGFCVLLWVGIYKGYFEALFDRSRVLQVIRQRDGIILSKDAALSFAIGD